MVKISKKAQVTFSRLIGGIVAIVLGAFLIGLAFTVSEAIWFLWLYGGIILAVGVVILLNSKEDKIEKIRVKKSIKTKRGLK